MKTALILALSLLSISCASAVPTGADNLCERYCQGITDSNLSDAG